MTVCGGSKLTPRTLSALALCGGTRRHLTARLLMSLPEGRVPLSLPNKVCCVCCNVMDPAAVMAGIATDHPPVNKTCSNLLLKLNLDATENPQAYFTNGSITNLAATKALIEANNNVFTVGELNSYNTSATNAFNDWVESVFNHCMLEILVFPLRKMHVGRGVYMTAMTRPYPSCSSGSVRRRQDEGVDCLVVF